MSFKVPITLANGTRIGPVTIVCSTVLFLAVLAGFVVLDLYGNPDNTLKLVGPALPVLATIASALLLYVKAHTVQQTAALQGQQAVTTAAEAKATVEQVGKAVADVDQQVADNATRLNGELEAKIAKAVAAALANHDAAVTAAVVTPAKKAPTKRATKKTTTRKAS